MAVSIRPTRGNRAGFNGLVSSSALVPGQIYAILDEKWLALATGPAAFIEVGRGDIDVPDPAIVSAIRAGTGAGYLSPPETWEAGAPVAIAPSAAPVLDLATGWTFVTILNVNAVAQSPINARAGAVFTWTITQDGAGQRTLSYANAWKFSGGAPALSTAAGAVDKITGQVISTLPLEVHAKIERDFR